MEVMSESGASVDVEAEIAFAKTCGVDLKAAVATAEDDLSMLETEVQTETTVDNAVYEVDYRSVLTPVKDQGAVCGNCWAHSAIQSVESARQRIGLPNVPLSPQQVTDCSISGKCKGGTPPGAWEYLKTNAAATLEEYPYDPERGSPPCNQTAAALATAGYLLEFKTVHTGAPFKTNKLEEDELLAALKANGPLALYMDSSSIDHLNEDSPIVPASSCGGYWRDHAVHLVGFGRDNGQPFWLIRNSWSAYWGMQGFFKLQAYPGVLRGSCGITEGVQYVSALSSVKPYVAPKPTGPPEGCYPFTSDAKMMLDLINKKRVSKKLPLLQLSKALSQDVKDQTRSMPTARVVSYAPGATELTDNIGTKNRVVDVFDLWAKRGQTQANIMSSSATWVGIQVVWNNSDVFITARFATGTTEPTTTLPLDQCPF